MIFKYIDNIVWMALLIPIIGIMVFGYLQRKKNLAKMVNPQQLHHLIPRLNYSIRFWKRLLCIGAFIFLILSLMKPQYGLIFKQVQRKGNDIFLVIDTSKSMLAQDIRPSRFEHAKREVLNLIEDLNGDRIGIIAFAGDAFIQCPLTLDYGALKLFLDYLQVGSVPVPGTDIATAIKMARKSFEKLSKDTNKFMIIMSDGESFENDPIKSAMVASDQNIIIHTVGIGTANGEPVPVYDENGKFLSYKKNKNNEPVLSKINERVLKEISISTGGDYFSSNLGEFVMDQIYKKISSHEKKILEESLLQMHKDRYQWFLAITFILLLFELLLSEQIFYKKAKWSGRIK